jgi:hypothetical protein
VAEVDKYLRLNYIPNDTKVSKRSVLNQVWEQTGQKPEELENLEPTIPSAGRDIWFIFWEIKTGEEISWADIDAYCRFNDIELDMYTISVILAMNSTYNSYISKVEFRDKHKNKGKNK